MKIGLCAWSFTGSHGEAGLSPDPFTPEGLTALARDRGLCSIEGASSWFSGLSPDQLLAFRENLESEGLGLFLDTGGADYASDTAPLDEAVELAGQLGAPVVRTTISNVLEGDRRELGRQGWLDHLDGLVAPLRRVAARADELGVSIGLENHQDACSEELVSLCERVGSDSVGVTFDCGNALAVGETPEAFAGRVLPVLKHVHLKDYAIHPTPSGYRFVRCPLGAGVVDWPGLLGLIERQAPGVEACIELGATSARHVRILETDYWSTYGPRPLDRVIDALRALHGAARPAGEPWRTPHELDEPPRARTAYELDQLDASVAYLSRIGQLASPRT